jgi:hypothetical protein
MEEIKVSEKFEGIQPAQVFEAGQAAFADLQMDIVKVRAFAYLIQAHHPGPDHQVNANFIVNAFQNECVLALTSETADGETLKALAERFFTAQHNHMAGQ